MAVQALAQNGSENGHGIKTVIVEKMDRLARDLLIQETVISNFREKGISLISAL